MQDDPELQSLSREFRRDSPRELERGESSNVSRMSRTSIDKEREANVLQILEGKIPHDTFADDVIDHPSLIMKQLLQHVKIDPDGGILNLDNANTERYNQHSKVHALKKSSLERALAFYSFFRAVANPIIVTYFSTKMLHGCYFQEPWFMYLRDATVMMRTPVPIMECFVFTAVAELLGIAILVALALSQGITALCSSGTYDMLAGEVSPRYTAMAAFYWLYVPYLHSFSALTPLAFVHPSLLNKNVRAFTLREDIARAKVEKFLGKENGHQSDQTLVMHVLSLIVNYDQSDIDDKEEFVHHHLDKPITHALRALQKSKVAQDYEYLKNDGLNPDAMFGCRTSFAHVLEYFVIASFLVLCLVVGAVGFLTKLTRCFILLTGDEEHAAAAPIFFLAFLNQSMGMMTVSRLLVWRVECFLFGGADAQMSTEEHYLMRVYLGSLAETVWETSSLTTFEKMCIMLQFDDDDLQQLIIEDSSRSKAKLVLRVKSYMQRTSASRWLKWKQRIVNCAA